MTKKQKFCCYWGSIHTVVIKHIECSNNWVFLFKWSDCYQGFGLAYWETRLATGYPIAKLNNLCLYDRAWNLLGIVSVETGVVKITDNNVQLPTSDFTHFSE